VALFVLHHLLRCRLYRRHQQQNQIYDLSSHSSCKDTIFILILQQLSEFVW
jgi:hypothetical protein